MLTLYTYDRPSAAFETRWRRLADLLQDICNKCLRFISNIYISLKWFCRSQLPHKSVNLSFTITNMQNKLTDLCGN